MGSERRRAGAGRKCAAPCLEISKERVAEEVLGEDGGGVFLCKIRSSARRTFLPGLRVAGRRGSRDWLACSLLEILSFSWERGLRAFGRWPHLGCDSQPSGPAASTHPSFPPKAVATACRCDGGDGEAGGRAAEGPRAGLPVGAGVRGWRLEVHAHSTARLCLTPTRGAGACSRARCGWALFGRRRKGSAVSSRSEVRHRCADRE